MYPLRSALARFEFDCVCGGAAADRDHQSDVFAQRAKRSQRRAFDRISRTSHHIGGDVAEIFHIVVKAQRDVSERQHSLGGVGQPFEPLVVGDHLRGESCPVPDRRRGVVVRSYLDVHIPIIARICARRGGSFVERGVFSSKQKCRFQSGIDVVYRHGYQIYDLFLTTFATLSSNAFVSSRVPIVMRTKLSILAFLKWRTSTPSSLRAK